MRDSALRLQARREGQRHRQRQRPGARQRGPARPAPDGRAPAPPHHPGLTLQAPLSDEGALCASPDNSLQVASWTTTSLSAALWPEEGG
ncbi:MAG: hypothetical protein U5L74_11015 [Ideonella sp.]|nr:hypothetical protein [Ideonella sp.]